MATLTRRQVLHFLIAMGGGVAWPKMPVAFAAEPALTLPELCQSLNLESGQRIGRHYLKAYPNEADLNELIQKVLADTTSNPDLGRRIQENCQADFAADRVVNLDDWHLSKTECQVYAIMSLVGQATNEK